MRVIPPYLHSDTFLPRAPMNLHGHVDEVFANPGAG